MKVALLVAVAVALLDSAALGAPYHGDCSSASPTYQHHFIFHGRLRGGALKGRVTAAGRCPHGRLSTACTLAPVGTYYTCHGTVGRCILEGYFYPPVFEGDYRCATTSGNWSFGG